MKSKVKKFSFKKSILLLTALLFILSLTGCGAAPLSDAFVEEDVIASAKETIETVNTLDYEVISTLLREDLRGDLTADDWEAAIGTMLTDAGAFQEYSTFVTVGQTDEATKADYAVVVAICKYENSKITYTLSYDTDLNLIGIYLK